MDIKTFANYHGWSDVYPFEVVKVVSDKTVEVREMRAERDTNWKPEWVVGGFAGHCTNQRDQVWHCESDPDAPVIRIRWSRAKGQWRDKHGRRFIMSDKPRRFYDYNF